MALAILFFSEAMAVRKFVLDHHRPFERREQLRFTLLGALAFVVVDSVVLALVALFDGGFKDIWPDMIALSAAPQEHVLAMVIGTAMAIAIILLVWGLVGFALLYFAAGMIAQALSKQLGEKGKI